MIYKPALRYGPGGLASVNIDALVVSVHADLRS
jgi:hypothetical protein